MLIKITVVQPFHFSVCPPKVLPQSLNHKLTSTDTRTKLIYPINPTPLANKQAKWSMWQSDTHSVSAEFEPAVHIK